MVKVVISTIFKLKNLSVRRRGENVADGPAVIHLELADGWAGGGCYPDTVANHGQTVTDEATDLTPCQNQVTDDGFDTACH